MAELNYCGVCGERLDPSTGECPRCRQNTEDSAGSIGGQRSVQAHDSRGFELAEDGSSPEIDDWKSFRGVGRQRIQVGDTLLNRYVIQAKLGSGGMGVVYRCLDSKAGVEVAMKAVPTLISNNAVEMEDIRSNFRLVHNLYHPRIAAVTHLEQDPETEDYYLVMELAQGQNLQQYRKSFPDDQMPLKEALPILRQVAEALDYAHSRGVIHRDIKPSNIMVGPGGDTKVLDFGLAAQVQSSMSRLSAEKYSTSGTAPYMSPEQWRGRRQDARTDQYALAVTTYELVAGFLPFANPDHDIMRSAVLNEEPEPIEGLAGHVWSVLKRALSKDAKARYETCSDFVQALDEAIKVPTPKAAVAPPPPKPEPPVQPAPAYEPPPTRPKPEIRNRSKPSRPKSKKGWLVIVLLLGLGVFIWWKQSSAPESNGEQGRPDIPTAPAVPSENLGQEGKPAGPTASSVGDNSGQPRRAGGPQAGSGWTVPDLGLEFVYVAPGSFRMGSTESDAYDDEAPVHPVELTRGYWFGKYEVTNGDWSRFLRESGYDGAADADSNYMRHHRDGSEYASTSDSYPMVYVSWKNAVAYCEWLTQRERDAGRLPQGYAYRLPTEAEWEYAAGGGKNGRSTKYSGSDNLGEVGWYSGNSGGKTHEVGGKRANELGLYDMSGNVWEWCWDWKGTYSSSSQRDPVGPGSGSYRVVRGGSWLIGARSCRVAIRHYFSPGFADGSYGFRVALAPQFN